jgi:signal transduction histidine kinase
LEESIQVNLEKSYFVEPIIKKIIKKFENHAKISFFSDKSVELFLSPDYLAIILNNLISNSIKYNDNSVNISIKTLKKDERIFLEVKDDGIGLNEEECRHIFERFYRVGDESIRESSGTGLGLYIVKKITELSGAEIFCSPCEKGLKFEIIFKPRKK